MIYNDLYLYCNENVGPESKLIHSNSSKLTLIQLWSHRYCILFEHAPAPVFGPLTSLCNQRLLASNTSQQGCHRLISSDMVVEQVMCLFPFISYLRSRVKEQPGATWLMFKRRCSLERKHYKQYSIISLSELPARAGGIDFRDLKRYTWVNFKHTFVK